MVFLSYGPTNRTAGIEAVVRKWSGEPVRSKARRGGGILAMTFYVHMWCCEVGV